jgi:hypothetical protein
LADGEVGAARVDGRVVCQERRHGDTDSICDRRACITGLYGPDGAAGLARAGGLNAQVKLPGQMGKAMNRTAPAE